MEERAMDDHFWPAMYPGIIVGFLLGLGGGNIISTILGTIGGLIGAAALHFVFTWLGLDRRRSCPSSVSLAAPWRDPIC
jgi:hypothetical protein